MPPGGEGNSERGVPLPLGPSPPWNDPASSTAAPSDRVQKSQLGQREETEQTPFLVRAGSFEAAQRAEGSSLN